MKVEIWSDVMCPFCYIGKRRFEKALSTFPDAASVEVVWKSFQLNPDMQTDRSRNINQYLAEIKGWSIDQARQMNQRVTEMAAAEGLIYDFDKAIPANSFDAHRLVQYAKTKGLGDAMEERLFRAYFTEGLDTSDHTILTELGTEAGLDAAAITGIMKGPAYGEEVERDIYEARQIGVNGVPYFVFNDRYAVSGAQSPETFLGALTQSLAEHKQQHPEYQTPEGTTGEDCSPNGDC